VDISSILAYLIQAMKKFYFLFSIIITTTLNGFSQASLGFTDIDLLDTNVPLNDTVDIQAFLHNYGNTAFNDSLRFGLLHDGVLVTDVSIWPGPYNGGPSPIEHINPSDSIPMHFYIYTNQPEFLVGPTGVVIWPIAFNQSLLVHDSLKLSLTILPPTGIFESGTGDNRIICSLLRNALLISEMNLGSSVYDVSLFQTTGGRVFTSQHSLPFEIPAGDLAAGVYILEIKQETGIIFKKKVFIPAGY
jgi:hypothetical protein